MWLNDEVQQPTLPLTAKDCAQENPEAAETALRTALTRPPPKIVQAMVDHCAVCVLGPRRQREACGPELDTIVSL